MARKASVDARLDTLAAAVAQLATVVSALTPTGSPAQVAVADQHIGPSGKADGRRFACTADGGCGRLLRSAARAAIHGVAAGGHTPADD